MKKSLYFLALVVAAFLVAGCAKSGGKSPGKSGDKPGQWKIQTDSWSATVESLNLSTRMATLKDQNGKRHTFKVSDEVQNLDKVRVGDIVEADVVQAYAISVRKSSEEPYAQELVDTQYGLESGLPTKTVVSSTVVTARVTEVDYDKRTMSLENPGGETVLVKVPEDVKRFKNIKVGDEVVTRYTQNTIYSVRKP